MTDLRYPIVELRQYTLRPGQRDVLISLFDREFVESQEECGMAIIGTFRDLDNPDRFVWLRGFEDMTSRLHGLQSFYSGPIWKAHSAAANATMVDVDNVLLLRPTSAQTGFPVSPPRPPVADHPAPSLSLLTATIYYRNRPFDDEFTDIFDRTVRPVLTDTGAAPLAYLQTEYAENTFPALPVRTGEHVFVWFARFETAAALQAHEDRLAADRRWPYAAPRLASQRLRLSPTARSALH
jgi:quinol monooxygenase YgiN